MNDIQILYCIFFVVANVFGLIAMWMDKRQAMVDGWRIPEKVLFAIAFFNGGIGATLGMFLFRHKTKHKYFLFGLPALALLNVIIFVYVLNFLGTL